MRWWDCVLEGWESELLYGDGDGCHADTIGCCHHLECPPQGGGGGEEQQEKEKEDGL